MQIRRATAADAPAIVPQMQRYWEFEGMAGFDRSHAIALLQGFLSNPHQGLCWIADHEGAVDGYLLAVLVFSFEHGGMMAEIDELFVAQTLRSAGIGSSLLAAAERDLRAAGAVRLQLQLNVNNERGREFYVRNGFEPREAYDLYEKPL
jgi:ribosomal protein S18 acetylase RimI-like enzyme